MVPLQNDMPLHEFVVASMPGASERDFLDRKFDRLTKSAHENDDWVLLRHLTVREFKNALSSYFKAGAGTLLLRLWSDLWLCV